jgi:glycosyltransferase involved in cell wall biosynthesis
LVEKDKKVLIITYYWPPSGGSGVQRWLKFVKYLPEFGWQPFVFTPENPSFEIRDESLLRDVPPEAEVFRFPIWEPYKAFGKISKVFTGQKTSTKPSALVSAKGGFFHAIATWVRGNFFIPDPRVFWVKPASKFLIDLVKENGIRTIITTGPPHSVHLIGLKLKEHDPTLRWLADFRDPWSEWGLLDSLKVGDVARGYHRRLEAKVLAKADDVITITPFYQRRFEKLGNRKVVLLTNGYDQSDFIEVSRTRSDKFLIRHIGIINEKCDPRPLMLTLEQMAKTNSDFARDVQLEFIGEVHPDFRNFVEENPALRAFTFFRGNIPHKELLQLYGSSNVLLIILTGYKDAEGYLPGKLFEYLATGIPIIGTGPEDGDAANVLNESKAGKMINEKNSGAIQQALTGLYNSWRDNAVDRPDSEAIQMFSRREITRKLSELLR